MSSQDKSEPAFPVGTATFVMQGGMTLRDYFAAKAMHVTIQMNDYNISEYQAQRVADFAYMVADAMLKARSA